VQTLGREEGGCVEPAIDQHAVEPAVLLHPLSHLLDDALRLLEVVQSLAEILLLLENTSQVIMVNDRVSLIPLSKVLSFDQPLLSSLSIALLGIPHRDGIHNLKHLLFLHGPHSSKLFFLQSESLILILEFFDFSPELLPLRNDTIFTHNLYSKHK
jgi:hypothetical protein